MTALVGLLLRTSIAGRRALSGWTAYLLLLVLVFTTGPSPLQETWAATSAGLVAATAWLVVAGTTVDRATTSLVAAAAGGPGRLHLLQAVATALPALPLGAVAVGWGALRSQQGASTLATSVAVAVTAHLAALLVGAGIGSLVSQPVLRERLLTSLAGGIAVIVALAVPASSPVGPVLTALGHDRGRLAPLLGWCVASLVWALLLSCLGAVVAARRRSYGTGAAP